MKLEKFYGIDYSEKDGLSDDLSKKRTQREGRGDLFALMEETEAQLPNSDNAYEDKIDIGDIVSDILQERKDPMSDDYKNSLLKNLSVLLADRFDGLYGGEDLFVDFKEELQKFAGPNMPSNQYNNDILFERIENKIKTDVLKNTLLAA